MPVVSVPTWGRNGSGAFVNLHAKLLEREASGRPVTVGLIGAGKYGTMSWRRA